MATVAVSCVSQLLARAAPVAYTNRVCAEGLHFSAFSLVFITVDVYVKRLANALHVHVWKAAQAVGQGLGRGKTVACAACSAQDLPHSHGFRPCKLHC